MLVSANIGVIWGVFIIISIVAQVIKSRRKVADQAPGGHASMREEGNQPATKDDELRQFLESLSGGKPRPEEIPPPVIQRQELQPMLQQAPQPQPQQKPKKQRRPEQPPAPIITQPVPSPTVRIMPAVELETVVTPNTSLQRLIRTELQQTNATRKAIVLREILGPPIALRPREKRL